VPKKNYEELIQDYLFRIKAELVPLEPYCVGEFGCIQDRSYSCLQCIYLACYLRMEDFNGKCPEASIKVVGFGCKK
jgi:hypothetical protein